MKKRLIKIKTRNKPSVIKYNGVTSQSIFKGDIDDYIYSWQSIKKVSER